MNTRYFALMLGFAVLLSAFPKIALTDTVILNSGEKFTSTQVWEEDGLILFNMHGLIVKVDKKDVASIVPDAPVQAQPVPMSPERQPQPEADGSVTPPPAESKTDPAPFGQSLQPIAAQRPLTRPPANSPAPATLNGTGLKGLAWKMAPEQIPGLVSVQTDWDGEDIDHYARPDEALRLGKARLDGIVYGFWKKRLYSIMFWVAGPPGYHTLKQVVQDHYGPGTKSERGLERYIWRTADTDRMLEFDKQLNTGIFWMRSRELDDQLKKK